MPETPVVDGQISSAGFDADSGIRSVIDEVRLAESLREEALLVSAGDDPQPALRFRRVVEVARSASGPGLRR